MKKIIYIIILFNILILTTGCNSKEELNCDIGQTQVTITIKKGQIINYYDKVNGNASKEEIAILNNQYLLNIDTNSKAIELLKEAMANNGGSCK